MIDCVVHPRSTERILAEARKDKGAHHLLPAMLLRFEAATEPERNYLSYLERLKSHLQSTSAPTIVLAPAFDVNRTEEWLTGLKPSAPIIITPTEVDAPTPRFDKLLVDREMATGPLLATERASQNYYNWLIFKKFLSGLNVTTVKLMGEMYFTFPTYPRGCVCGANLWLKVFGLATEIAEGFTYPNSIMT